MSTEAIIVLTAWLSGLTGVPLALPSEAAETLSFELQDQFGGWHSTDRVDAEVLVLVGGDRAAREATRSWALTLGDLLETGSATHAAVEVLRLADLRGIPKGLRPVVARQLRKAYATPILMDWDGQLVGRFSFTPRLANIAVIDRAGRVKLHLRTQQPRPDEVDALARTLGLHGLEIEKRSVDGYSLDSLGSSL